MIGSRPKPWLPSLLKAQAADRQTILLGSLSRPIRGSTAEGSPSRYTCPMISIPTSLDEWTVEGITALLDAHVYEDAHLDWAKTTKTRLTHARAESSLSVTLGLTAETMVARIREWLSE